MVHGETIKARIFPTLRLIITFMKGETDRSLRRFSGKQTWGILSGIPYTELGTCGNPNWNLPSGKLT